MDTAQWPQESGVMRNVAGTSFPKEGDNNNNNNKVMTRPQKEQGLNCPRCNSTNTKFCYYNNYSLSQPRYYCKTCRRYWTAGGSLRNIPVGGGSRKNKRPSSSSSNSNNNSSAKHIKLITNNVNVPDPKIHVEGGHNEDLNLAFSRGFMTPFMMPPGQVHDPSTSGLVYTSGFSSLQDHHLMKPPSLNFSLDGLGLSTSFPFQDLKQQVPSSSTSHDHNHQGNGDMINISSGYWSGMLGGGGSW